MPVSTIMAKIGQIESRIQSMSGMNAQARPQKDNAFSSAVDKSVAQLGQASTAAQPTAAQILEALEAGPVQGSAYAGQESPNLEAIKALLQQRNPAAVTGAAGITAPGIGQAMPGTVEGMPMSTDLGQAIVKLASKHIGKDYVWGGESDAEGGFDCSGLVQDAFKRAGIKMPRVAKDQAKVGEKINSLSEALPGDLLTFGNPAHHIGIYVGDNKMLEAPSRGKKIRIKELNRKITDIRRVRPAGTTLGDVAAKAVGATNATKPAAISTNVAGMNIPPENATSQKLRAALQAAAAASNDPEYLAVTNVNDKVSNVPYAHLFNQAGAKYGFSPRFLAAIAKTESNFNPQVVSHAGAVGVMQLMPVTAREVGVDPKDRKDVVTNIDGATQYIAKYFAKQPNVSMGLAAYNAGPGAVRKYNGVPPYKETQNYVVRVRKYMAGIS